MSKKKTIIPELRFKDFINNGDWEEKALNKIAKRILLKNKEGLINTVFTNSAIEGIIDQREYFDKDIADKNNLDNYYVVAPGDYVYNPRISSIAPVGPISKNKTNKIGAMSPLYTVFRFNDKNNEFYEYYFKSAHWYDSIKKLSNTGARFDRVSITDSVFMDIPVLCPHPVEQKKIADCLASINDVISIQSKKIQALKDHKKGLIYQLFPNDKEAIPRLRFKEFKTDGKWKKINLLDVIDRKIKWSFIGGPFGSNLKSSDYTSDGIRIIQLQNIGDGQFNNDYKIFTSIEKADELLSCNIYSGDIIMSKMGDPVGRACLIPNFHNRYVMCSDGIRLVVDEKKYDKYFIYSLINSPHFRALIEKNSTGSTRKRIGLDVLKKLSIVVPEKKEEQKKIGECLSLLDTQIEAEIKRFNFLTNHKKGLTQKLFPI